MNSLEAVIQGCEALGLSALVERTPRRLPVYNLSAREAFFAQKQAEKRRLGVSV